MEKLGPPQTPAKDCVLYTPAFPGKDGDPPLLVHLDTAMYIVPYCKRLEKWFEGQIHLGYAFTETFA